jgi:FkbM family methyltransferase
LSVFETVFVDREFEWYVPTEPRFIIDGGANVGFSTAFFANRFPGARVIAVEPSNENVSMLRTNCQGIENITVVEGGLWPVSGFLRIANPNDPTWSFRCEVAQENAEDAFPAYSVGDIIDRSGFQRCDLLKLDIEGAEEQLFSESRDWLARVDAILVEVHGGKALAAVKDACPVRQWEYKECGEKLLILPRESQT